MNEQSNKDKKINANANRAVAVAIEAAAVLFCLHFLDE